MPRRAHAAAAAPAGALPAILMHPLPCRLCLPPLQGGFQYWLYNHLFVRMCAGMTQRLGHLGSAPVKVFIDQAIQ